jgi:hypothetical protein
MVAMRTIWMKSPVGSNGSLRNKAGVAECVELLVRISV